MRATSVHKVVRSPSVADELSQVIGAFVYHMAILLLPRLQSLPDRLALRFRLGAISRFPVDNSPVFPLAYAPSLWHTTGEAVDVDELVHVINNRQRLIDLKADLEHNAKIVLEQANTLEQEYELTQEVEEERSLAEYRKREDKVDKYKEKIGYNWFTKTDTPQERKAEEMAEALKTFQKREELRLDDIKRQHYVDLHVLKEKGNEMYAIAQELDSKVQAMEVLQANGIIGDLLRRNPAGNIMPRDAESGLRKAEYNYPRPHGKRFPVRRGK